MNIAYITTNIKKHDLESKRVDLDKSQIQIDKVVVDTLKVRNKREKLHKLINNLEEKDIIVATSFEELADNSKEFLSVVTTLKDKKVDLISIKENFNTTIPRNKEMLDIFESLNALDKKYGIKQRRDGINSMKVNYEGKKVSNRTGNTIGRPSKDYPSNFFEVIEQWDNKLINAKKAMELTGLKRTTFYKLVKRYREEEFIDL